MRLLLNFCMRKVMFCKNSKISKIFTLFTCLVEKQPRFWAASVYKVQKISNTYLQLSLGPRCLSSRHAKFLVHLFFLLFHFFRLKFFMIVLYRMWREAPLHLSVQKSLNSFRLKLTFLRRFDLNF